MGFPGGASSKETLGRSSGEGNGNPRQYPYQENPVARGAWRAAIHRVGKSSTQLNELSTYECAVSICLTLTRI